jgi:hypothetical protein
MGLQPGPKKDLHLRKTCYVMRVMTPRDPKALEARNLQSAPSEQRTCTVWD